MTSIRPLPQRGATCILAPSPRVALCQMRAARRGISRSRQDWERPRVRWAENRAPVPVTRRGRQDTNPAGGHCPLIRLNCQASRSARWAGGVPEEGAVGCLPLGLSDPAVNIARRVYPVQSRPGPGRTSVPTLAVGVPMCRMANIPGFSCQDRSGLAGSVATRPPLKAPAWARARGLAGGVPHVPADPRS